MEQNGEERTQSRTRKNRNLRRQKSDLVGTAKRRAFVLELRKAGATYRAIVTAAVKKFGEDKLPSGYDCRAASLDVSRELQKLNKECQQTVAEVKRIELERLDVALFALWPQVRRGHLGAINSYVKLLQQRARLCGLYMPTDVDITSGGERIGPIIFLPAVDGSPSEGISGDVV